MDEAQNELEKRQGESDAISEETATDNGQQRSGDVATSMKDAKKNVDPEASALVEKVERLKQEVIESRREALQNPSGNAFFALFK